MTISPRLEETLGGTPASTEGVAPQSHLTAIVLVDAAGSTLAMTSNEVEALRLVERALDIFAAAVEKRNGRILSTTGDGAFGVFDSVARAVAAALDFQQVVQNSRRSESDLSLDFRVGVHLGEVFEEGGRAYGDSLNLTERIQSAAPVGGVCVSDLVYRAIRGRPEFSFEYLGPHTLKNVSEPIELYRIFGGEAAVLMKASPRPATAGPAKPAGLTRLEALERPSIAVLPLRNLSSDAEQNFFADGVTDDIITSLSRFRGIDLIARGSSFALRDKQLAITEIGSRLGARYIAQGSIRFSATRVRVTIELCDAVTEHAIWAEKYDRPLEDIFDIQDEVATLAVSAMSARIEEAERERLTKTPATSVHAYGLVLNAQNHLLNFTAADTALARDFYQKAILASPSYGRAFAGLSRSCSLDWRYSWSEDPSQSLTRAFDIAVQAVNVDPNDARGHAELGFVQLYRKEHDRSLASYRRALSFNPNDANIIAEMADALTHSGQSEEALKCFERAIRLNPFYPDQYLWDMAGAYMKLHRFEESIECVSRMHNVAQGRRLLACCYAHLGRMDEAYREAELIRVAQPGFSAERWIEIVPDRRREDKETLLRGLAMAGL
jgi:TolB-like protein/class 3 adenylate cyclase